MKIISSPEIPKPVGHYSPGIEHNGLVFVSGQIPRCPKTGVLKIASIAEETIQCLENIDAVLRAAGTDRSKVLKVTAYISSVEYWPELNQAYAEFFGDHRPARAVIPVGQFNGFNVEIDAIASM